MHDHSILDSYTHPESSSVRSASRAGTLARSTGQPASLNPYLGIAVNEVGLSDAQHADWVLCCRAWWRGWDAEETRRKPDQLVRHSLGSIPSPKPSDVPLDPAASLDERIRGRSGDFVTSRV